MGRKIIKKLGGERIGSGNKMLVTAHGYGYSTHDVGKVTRTSMTFGTIVPMGQWLLTTGSRLRMNLDALITSNALLYQLYGSAKFQVDVYTARMALYNSKMLINLNDQGYEVEDVVFPQFELTTVGLGNPRVENKTISNRQVNASALLRMLGIAGNGQVSGNQTADVTRRYNAMWMLMYYQIYKEYYANKQEKIGMMIHNEAVVKDVSAIGYSSGTESGLIPEAPVIGVHFTNNQMDIIISTISQAEVNYDAIRFNTYNVDTGGGIVQMKLDELCVTPGVYDAVFNTWTYAVKYQWTDANIGTQGLEIINWKYNDGGDGDMTSPKLAEFDLKAIDRMQMAIMKNVDQSTPLLITGATELPYGASLKGDATYKSINTTQEGLCIGTYQSDVFNNWLDNTTINNLNNKSKVQVDGQGEFSIDLLNLTQKMYNYDMRIGVTDGTLDEWREMTYAQAGKSKSLKPVYEGGLSKEIVFDMVVSTAGTEADPLGSIASRGQFGNKHKGGYVQIEADEEKLVMVLAKITPRLVYNQGNDWTVNLRNLDDLHKPAFDKIGYQNLLSDQSAVFETIVNTPTGLTTKSIGKQPAWQWYRTAYDTALGNMADEESYKVFGREYEAELDGNGNYIVKDQTTYIDPMKFNDVFAIESLDAMNFDVQVGMDATLTLVMSEELIPQL